MKYPEDFMEILDFTEDPIGLMWPGHKSKRAFLVAMKSDPLWAMHFEEMKPEPKDVLHLWFRDVKHNEADGFVILRRARSKTKDAYKVTVLPFNGADGPPFKFGK